MENEDKATVIRRWIDPEERITVDRAIKGAFDHLGSSFKSAWTPLGY
jgi:hypothetical protein